MPPPRSSGDALTADGHRSDGQRSDGHDEAHRLEPAVRGLLDVALDAAGELEQRVAPAHLRALQALERIEPAHVSALADATGLLRSTASRLCDRLDAAGLITRGASPTNRRATLLELTPDGRDVLDELRQVRTERLRVVLARMDEDGRAALLEGARAFTAAIEDAGP